MTWGEMLAGEPLFLWAVGDTVSSPHAVQSAGSGEGSLHEQGWGWGTQLGLARASNVAWHLAWGGKEHLWFKHGHREGKEVPARDKSAGTLDPLA